MPCGPPPSPPPLHTRGLKAMENNALAELDLGYNEIKDDGACALAQVRWARSAWLVSGAWCLACFRCLSAWLVSGASLFFPQRHQLHYAYHLSSAAPTCPSVDLNTSPPPPPRVFTYVRQALKANVDGAPKDIKLNSNYITRFGQVAMGEAVDMVGGCKHCWLDWGGRGEVGTTPPKKGTIALHSGRGECVGGGGGGWGGVGWGGLCAYCVPTVRLVCCLSVCTYARRAADLCPYAAHDRCMRWGVGK